VELINKLNTFVNFEDNKTKKNYILIIILFLSPLVLLDDLLFIKNDLLLNSLKIFIFSLSLTLVPFKNILKYKLNLLILIFSLYIVFITLIYRPSADILYSILYVIPFLLLTNKSNIFLNNKKLIIYFSIIMYLSLIYVILMPNEIVAGKSVLAFLVNGPHTSTYSLLIFYFLFFIFYKSNLISKYLFIIMSLITVFILFGYKARNAELAFILFFISFYFFESKYSNSLRYTVFFIISVFLIIFIFLLNGFFTLDWNEISSGRLLSWNERINILINYDFNKTLFGQGYGADIMKTKQWWWDEKPSHNDFLSLIFNSGLLSLTLFIIILVKLFKEGNSFQKALIIFIIITSLTNTGYLGRPIQFLYLIIIYLYANILLKKSSRELY
jgi:hypothetical protein